MAWWGEAGCYKGAVATGSTKANLGEAIDPPRLPPSAIPACLQQISCTFLFSILLLNYTDTGVWKKPLLLKAPANRRSEGNWEEYSIISISGVLSASLNPPVLAFSDRLHKSEASLAFSVVFCSILKF